MHSFAKLLVASSLLLAACASDETDVAVDDGGSIIDVARSAGDFTTLLAAVDAAGLTSTLDGEGPFTVVAPTDAAFANLPAGTVDALLADVPALTDVLLYHVVDGKVPASVVVEQSLVGTVQGTDFKVTVEGDVVKINGARVTVTDIEADNGIIHVIDAVLTPPGTITDIAVNNPDFSTLVAALGAADLADTLAGEGPFTVFAPTNAAFDKLPAGTVAALLNDIPTLKSILLYHVAGEKLVAADVVGASSVTTLSGEAQVVVSNGGVTIAGATIVMTDIPASNGVIHVLDAVMLPPAN